MARSRDTTKGLSIINGYPARMKGPSLLHELVAPPSPAIAIDFLEHGSNRRQLSYETLHTLSDALAQKIALSVARLECASAIVPVLLPQSPELYIALLAILKAGKAFCPLGLDTPSERLNFILEDISADLLVTDVEHSESLDLPSNIFTLHVDELSDECTSEKKIPSNPDKNSLAYVLYTSGSTGSPKAVSISHCAVTQSLLAHERHIPSFSRFLQFAAPTFDVSIFEIFFPWYRGRTLVGCTRAHMLNDLPETIRNLKVDAAELTPTVVGNLLSGRSSVPNLRLLLTIGEMLTKDVISGYGHSDQKDGVLWAMYGPTEASIHCTVQPRISATATVGTIGIPLDTVSAFVAGPVPQGDSFSTLTILPIGEEGELVLGGHQIAGEYLKRPELTRASFMHHPEYGYLYRTGDRARLRSDGILECLGRITTGQVKLKGQRVELGEIEQVIMKLSTCRAVAVLIVEEELVAFCATTPPHVSRRDVELVCKRWLPEVMVPSRVVFLHSMPQLPSGKIDRASLTADYQRTLRCNGTPSAIAKAETSHPIIQILSLHLGTAMDVETELASAGLDSLQAIRLSSALRKQDYNVTTMTLLSAITAGDVVAAADASELQPVEIVTFAGYSLENFPELERFRSTIKHILPCTPLQEGMLAETNANPSAYCNWFEVELAESHTITEIKEALCELAIGNEILRSGFYPATIANGSFLQVVWKELEVSQIREVESFTRNFSLDTSESLLRPLSVQAISASGKIRLVFQAHHALYDGWSLDLIMRDLGMLLRKQNAPRRPQFQDVVRYHAQYEHSTENDRQYWLDLLRDWRHLSLPNFNGRIVKEATSRSITGRSTITPHILNERARELQVNPQVLFQAAVAFVTSLYLGSPDVIIGNVTSGRTISVAGVEDIIGPCIASLPCRLHFDRLTRVQDILIETQRLNRESLEHCSLPLRDITKAANVPAGGRLFEILFVWQQSMYSNIDVAGPVHLIGSADELEFKITVEYEPHRDHISFRVTFDTTTIPEDQAVQFSRQVDQVVQYFLNHLDCKTFEAAQCLDTASLSIANAKPRQTPIIHGPAHAVEKWALETPNSEAVIFFHGRNGAMRAKATITYVELNRRANRLAHCLLEHGGRAGVLVGVIMEKSVELYISILAVLKIGAGYLPLVPDMPGERMRTILSSAQVTVCISDGPTSSHVRKCTSAPILCMEQLDLSGYSVHDVESIYEGSNTAYAVFTSGSTGTPKGVLVTQDNLMSNLDHLSKVYPYSAGSRLLQACSQAFDVSVFEIFFSWYNGMSFCTATKDDLFADLEGAINTMRITHLSLTPTVAALVNPDNVPRVEFLVTAGEAVTEHVRRQWAGRGLYQGYGPSETTNICTLRPSVSLIDSINNIGQPFDNTSAFVLDPQDTVILPRGAVGELCFGGFQVFHGYLNQPDLTAAKILNHPEYGRIYRSGDLGVMLHDDTLLFVGRIDDQVKIRGQRVELGEITSAVLDQNGVHDCATLLVGSDAANRLVTFWVPTTPSISGFSVLDPRAHRSTISNIYASLARYLPDYMVPSHFVPISQLPMTLQGKIDKRLLESSLASLSTEDLEATSSSFDASAESLITDQWEAQAAQVLTETLRISTPSINRTTPFFILGLDSVSAIRFSNGLRREGLGDFAISDVLRNSTIARLSDLRDKQSIPRDRTRGTVQRPENAINEMESRRLQAIMSERGIPVSKILPCTPLQEAMISSSQSSSEASYTNIMVFNVKGDLERLQRCWFTMTQRHDILRTAFVSTNDPSHAYAQVVTEDFTLDWGELPWSSDVSAFANRKVLELLQAHRPPVWLAVARATQFIKLLFCCHHAIYDGTAMQVLLGEMQTAYHDRELPPPVSYAFYLEHMLSQNLDKADEFWRTSFQGYEPTFFPDVTGRSNNNEPTCATYKRSLELPLSEIRAACQSASLFLLSVIHATWATLLHFYTGETDLCFGNVVSGRALPGHDLERVVAPCFNTIPVRVKLDSESTNKALLKLVQDFNVDSLRYQLTPLRRIQKIVIADGVRLFDTLVILQQPTEALDDSIWTLEEDRGEMDLPLVCEILQCETLGKLELVLHYHSSILSDTEAAIVADTFDATFKNFVTHPGARVSDTLDLPSRLRAKSNSDFKTYDTRGQFLHSGFETNAREWPDRTALDFLHAGGARTIWSFGMLDDKANNIAHALLNAGVRVEKIVPIYISKTPLFYASILGVLKAGAAFAPVHPDLPDARKRLMLAELDAEIVLVTEHSPISNDVTEAVTLDVGALKWTGAGKPTVQGITDANLAYCLFTSGSTGVPKAVSMEHRAPIHTIESSRSLVPWNTDSRLLQYAATTFDMCYYDCFLAWTFGFTLCSAEQQLLLDELPSTINTMQVTLLDLTPSVAASVSRKEVPNVEWLYCIGEAMSPSIVNEWEGACVNSYGPTESAFCTTIHPVSKHLEATVIGRPFPSTSFAIFPTHGDYPLPMLSTGELYIGGAQLARGYLGKPKLTDEKFITRCGQRFYRSGDLVRMLADGNFEFIGRTDDQVKIRGLRVELEEINSVLRNACADVAAIVTLILKKDTSAREQLVAFVLLSAHRDRHNCEDIRKQLGQIARDRLHSYMVPQFLIFVEQIPLSPAGKVDRRALGEIFRSKLDEEEMCNGTDQMRNHRWTKAEAHIRDVFARLSNSQPEDVLPTTTIYQLGLDSISAVQIATGLRHQGYAVRAADVMKHLTCIEIGAHLNPVKTSSVEDRFDFHSFDAKHRPYVLGECDVFDEKVTVIRPCTPLQMGMISQMLAKNGAVYMNHIRLELYAGVDLEKLENAWRTAMNEHQMLRTGFVKLRDKRIPYGMVEYASDAVDSPWNPSREGNTEEALDDWRESCQRKAAEQLHRPPWGLRSVHTANAIYLDLVIFHGLFDANSLQAMFHTVVAAYEDVSIPRQAAIDPVIEEILHRSGDPDGQGRNFWKSMGEHAAPFRFPGLAPLKLERLSPATHTHQSRKNMSNLQKACREANTTMQSAGLASWLSLLSAYTGESTVTCGVVLAGRDFEAAEKSAFPCINTVPFTYRVTQDLSDMLRSITSSVAELQQFQHIPLTEIQRIMGFPTEALFDNIFAYQKLPVPADENRLWTVVDETASIEYPVSIELESRQDHLEYRLTFLPHTIPQEQAMLMLKQLDHLVETFLFQDTGRSAVDETLYSVTPAQEPVLPSEAQLLHEFVEITARKSPQRIGLEFARSIDGDRYSAERWTYSELNAEGNKVANLLIVNGVRPGELVGVCFDKCPEASFAILGVLKTGCAFVAIDPGAPAARQTFIARDSGVVAVLSMMTNSRAFRSEIDVPVLNLDETNTASLRSCQPTLTRPVTPRDRSYCLYTSGTTGTPKGCELTHENAVQALLSFQRLFAGHWNAESRWLQFASFHFDVSVLEQFWSWSVGICVVSAPRDVIFEDIANSIRTLRITHIDLTPSLAQTLHPDQVPSLCEGVFITGGESLKQEILDTWGPKGVIYNGYGPTEATIGCTMYPRVPANGKPSNIGPQFDNVGTYVLKPGCDIPVLRGGVGELCVSGKLVGKGYLNRDGLTKKSFPYLSRFKERVYRTGDLVRILYDDTFEFLGRADDQVKLRGQRLEIGEINSVIRQSSKHISDVATLILKHPRQQKEQLVAFVVQDKRKGDARVSLGKGPELGMARDACHERLPPYMVPTHFVPLTSLPLNVNNKADGKKLKALYEELSVADLQKLSVTANGSDESWSNPELKLRNVIATELDTNEDALGRDVSFFELGMDSISAISVTRVLKEAGIRGTTASLIMRHSTVRRLAKVLSSVASSTSDRASLLAAKQSIAAIQHRHRRAIAQLLSVDVTEIGTVAPCTPLQHGMIARSLDSDSGLYFNAFVFGLSNDIDHDRLREAWQSVFETTEILRTIFIHTEDGYVQAVMQTTALPWEVDETEMGEDLPSCVLRVKRKWLQQNKGGFFRPFELVVTSNAEQQLLVVHVFHAVYDGISIELVFQAVWDAYNGSLKRNDAPSFHSALAHGPLKIEDGAEAFWRRHLLHSAAKPLPSRTGSRSRNPTKSTREFTNPTGFERIRRRLNVTPQAIIQACWLNALQRLIKGATVVGVVVSGRSIDLEGADRVIGPMFNTIPYYHQPQQDELWASLVKRVHEFNVAAHPYQHTPLRNIIKWSKHDPSRPLFDNLFVFHHVGQSESQWSANRAWKLLVGESIADYPLAIEIQQAPTGILRVTLVTQGHVADELTLDELLDNFGEALRQAIDEPEMLLETCPGAEDVALDDEDIEDPTANQPTNISAFGWTDEAKQLRQAFADLSNSELEDISATTSIFELGLDSIDAIQLSSKLKKSGMDLSVSEIMRDLTITNMLPNLRKTEVKQAKNILVDSDMAKRKHMLKSHLVNQNVDMSQIENVLPLTPLQEAMVADMINSDFKRYYNFDVLKLGSNTNIDRLRDAWAQVVQTSPILRTSFFSVEDTGVDAAFAQITYSQSHDFWTEINADGVPDFPALFEALRNEAKDSVASKPPFQVVCAIASQQTYLVLAIAHALYDGWSLGLLHADVKRAYGGHLEPRPSYEPVLSQILSDSGTNAADYWADYLFTAKPSIFARRMNFDKLTAPVHRLEHESKVSANELSQFAKKSNVSLQALGQAVFAIVLASYVQSLDVVFGSVLSGRDDETSSEVLFPVMNTVAVRTVLHGSRLELLQHLQGGFTELKQHQHFPLRKALALADAHAGLFESLFICQRNTKESQPPADGLYSSVEGRSDVEYPVCVEMEIVNGKLVWRCAVKDEVLDEAGSLEMMDKLDLVLYQIMTSAQEPVIRLISGGASVCGLPPFKVDEKATFDEFNKVYSDEISQESPSDPQTARIIRKILAAVSGTAEDKITDDMTIFHLGLDSISAIKVSSLLRRQNVVLSVGEMLRASTISSMARIARSRSTQQSKEEVNLNTTINQALAHLNLEHITRRAGVERSVQSGETMRVLPATAGQMYMLSMWLNTRGTDFYPDFTYRVHGSISSAKLQDAWNTLVAANPILRTTFVGTQDSQIPYIQVVRDEQHHTSIIDNTTPTQKESKVSQPWAQLYSSRTKGGWDLKLRIHHTLYDGVSLRLLMRQFQYICDDRAAPQPDDTFLQLVASTVKSSAVEARKLFWADYLDSFKRPNIVNLVTSSTRTEIFSPQLLATTALDGVGRKIGVSIQAIFLAAYAKLYAKSTSTPECEDVVIGVYLANRSLSIAGIEVAAVPTVNVVPLRIRAPFTNGLADSARQIQQDLQRIGELANATASLWEISEWTGVKVDTVVNFLTLPDAEGVREQDCEKGVKIVAQNHWAEAVSRVTERAPDDEITDNAQMEHLKDMNVNSAYMHTIDIEVTVRDGGLDVGIFAPVEMLGLEDGNKFMQDLKSALQVITY